MKAPHAAEPMRIRTIAPIFFKMRERIRDGQFVPFVIDVEQRAALWTAMQDLAHIKGRVALGIDTALKRVHNTYSP